MPQCLKCEKKFPNTLLIEGKIRNLCNRKFCIECSPFGSHNTKSLIRDLKELVEKTCDRCGRLSINKKCPSCHVIENRQRQKLWALEYKGSCCQACGFNTYIAALEFHHLDPSKNLESLLFVFRKKD